LLKLNRLIACVCILSLMSPTLLAEKVDDIERRIAELGEGAELKLKLTDGKKLRGIVDTIGVDGIAMRNSHGLPVQDITYAEIASIEATKRTYRSDSGPDLIAAYRVAVALGPGHHVLARVRNGRTYRGHIEEVNSESLTVRLDRTGQPVVIPYAEIDHLEQNLSRLAKIGIIAGIGVGICVAIYLRIVLDPNY
jgi:hypothetical protein